MKGKYFFFWKLPPLPNNFNVLYFLKSVGKAGGTKPKRTKNSGKRRGRQQTPGKDLMQWTRQVAEVVKDSAPKHQSLSSSSPLCRAARDHAEGRDRAIHCPETRHRSCQNEMFRSTRSFRQHCWGQDCSAPQSQPLKEVSPEIRTMSSRKGPQMLTWNSHCPKESIIQMNKLWKGATLESHWKQKVKSSASVHYSESKIYTCTKTEWS